MTHHEVRGQRSSSHVVLIEEKADEKRNTEITFTHPAPSADEDHGVKAKEDQGISQSMMGIVVPKPKTH